MTLGGVLVWYSGCCDQLRWLSNCCAPCSAGTWSPNGRRCLLPACGGNDRT